MRVCLTHCCRRFYAPHPLKIVEGCLISQHLVLQNRQLNGCCSTVWSESGILIVCFENNKKGRKWLWIIGSFVLNIDLERLISDALLDLVPFVQLKKSRSNHGGMLLLVKLMVSACSYTESNTPPWLFFTFLKLCKAATSLKVTLLHECFLCFLNCTNGTKVRKKSHIFDVNSGCIGAGNELVKVLTQANHEVGDF